MTSGEIITIGVAILTFVGTCITAWASIRKASIDSRAQMTEVEAKMDTKFSELERKVDKNSEHNTEQFLGIQRLTVMNSEMPISERLIAGKKYIDAGGNGDVKKYYEQLIEEHTI